MADDPFLAAIPDADTLENKIIHYVNDKMMECGRSLPSPWHMGCMFVFPLVVGCSMIVIVGGLFYCCNPKTGTLREMTQIPVDPKSSATAKKARAKAKKVD